MDEEGRAPDRLEVRLVTGDEVPVGRVRDGRERVSAQPCELLGHDQHGERERHRKEEEERRQQPARPTDPEPDRIDPPRRPMLRQQEGRDQVAADDEEDLDAEEPAGESAETGVVDDDGEDGDGTEPIETAKVSEGTRVSLERRSSGGGRGGVRWDRNRLRHCSCGVVAWRVRTLPGDGRSG